MANSLSPAFVRLFYHSEFASHTMTLPTTAWNDVISVGGHGQFDAWSGGGRDADDMIKDLVDKLKAFFDASVIFDNYIIYTKADAEAPELPVTGNSLAVVGTNPAPGWFKAVQATWSFRTTAFGDSKLTLLDAASGDDFDKITNITGITAAEALRDEWQFDGNGWSGRDNNRPTTFVQIAYTLNEKLRREYNMN